MQNALQVFDYKGANVRTVERDGEVWFVAKDVADILGFDDATHAVRGLDDDEKGLQKVETLKGMQDMTIVSEPGLYGLILRSNKPEAKQFARWVRHDVLPQIHHTGSYSPKGEDRELRMKELDSNLATIDLERAKILQRMLEVPAVPLSDESKAVIQHEVFKIITGEQCISMLPAITDKYYSATELGEMFGVSSKKIGKVAKANGLKSEEGEPSEFGQWRLSKSRYSSHQCATFVYNTNALDWMRAHSELLA